MNTPPQKWLGTMGAAARVLVIDNAFTPDKHVTFKNVLSYESRPDVAGTAHGTVLARAIASRNPMNFGIAPLCELHAAEAITFGACYQNIVDALRYALKIKADVVSMSWAYTTPNPEIEALLRQLDDAGCICCAAYSDAMPFPHSLPYVISCGPLDASKDADVQTLDEVDRMLSENGGRKLKGSSASTAYVAGIAACAKSYDPRLNRVTFLAEMKQETPPV